MIPHERSLVKRLAEQPFALLGISADEDGEKLKEFLRGQDITWPVWWDKGFKGPIVKQWNVHSYPSLYVLDHRGTIRFKNVHGKALDEAVDRLLGEMNTSRPSGKP